MDFGSFFFLALIVVAIAAVLGSLYYFLVPHQRWRRHIKHIHHQPWWEGMDHARTLVRAKKPKRVGDCYFWQDSICIVRLAHEGSGHVQSNYEGGMAIIFTVKDEGDGAEGNASSSSTSSKETLLYKHERTYGWWRAVATITPIALPIKEVDLYAMEHKLWPLYLAATRKALVT